MIPKYMYETMLPFQCSPCFQFINRTAKKPKISEVQIISTVSILCDIYLRHDVKLIWHKLVPNCSGNFLTLWIQVPSTWFASYVFRVQRYNNLSITKRAVISSSFRKGYHILPSLGILVFYRKYATVNNSVKALNNFRSSLSV